MDYFYVYCLGFDDGRIFAQCLEGFDIDFAAEGFGELDI